MLSDGGLSLPASTLASNVPETERAAFLQANGDDPNTRASALNITLIRKGDALVLVDTGAGMNFFELVTTVPPEIFLPIGGLLIAIFAAWVMPASEAMRALDAGPGGFRLWRGVVRYVSIPLLVIVLLSALW